MPRCPSRRIPWRREIGAPHGLSLHLQGGCGAGWSPRPALGLFSRLAREGVRLPSACRRGKGDCVFVYWGRKFQKGKSFFGTPHPSQLSLTLGKFTLSKTVGEK